MTTVQFQNSIEPINTILSISKDKVIFSIGNSNLTNKDIIHLMQNVLFFKHYMEKNVFIDLFIKNDLKLLETFIKSFYFFTHSPINFKKKKVEKKITFELLYDKKDHLLNELINKNKIIVKLINEVKDLIEIPPDLIYPQTLLDYILDFSKRNSLNVLDVYDENRLKAEGFNGILTVGKGSLNKPRMAIVEYNNKSTNNPIVLVGKGITYDSGGYSLKQSMKDMKRDKTGVCIILGILGILAKLNVKTRVIGILPMAENLIGNTSYKPDEIIKSYNGRTVEIFDTDAEGRLLLMDGLSLAKKYNPSLVIDVSTLTGVSVFCSKMGSIFSNNIELAWKFQKVSSDACDNFWFFPIIEDWINDTKNTKLANFKNHGFSCESSTVMAASFLSNFIENIPWVHFDLGDSFNIYEMNNPNNLNSSNSLLTILEYILQNS